VSDDEGTSVVILVVVLGVVVEGRGGRYCRPSSLHRHCLGMAVASR
jgi:hypothetical protein